MIATKHSNASCIVMNKWSALPARARICQNNIRDSGSAGNRAKKRTSLFRFMVAVAAVALRADAVAKTNHGTPY
jgi:hypothetical protein